MSKEASIKKQNLPKQVDTKTQKREVAKWVEGQRTVGSEDKKPPLNRQNAVDEFGMARSNTIHSYQRQNPYLQANNTPLPVVARKPNQNNETSNDVNISRESNEISSTTGDNQRPLESSPYALSPYKVPVPSKNKPLVPRAVTRENTTLSSPLSKSVLTENKEHKQNGNSSPIRPKTAAFSSGQNNQNMSKSNQNANKSNPKLNKSYTMVNVYRTPDSSSSSKPAPPVKKEEDSGQKGTGVTHNQRSEPSPTKKADMQSSKENSNQSKPVIHKSQSKESLSKTSNNKTTNVANKPPPSVVKEKETKPKNESTKNDSTQTESIPVQSKDNKSMPLIVVKTAETERQADNTKHENKDSDKKQSEEKKQSSEVDRKENKPITKKSDSQSDMKDEKKAEKEVVEKTKTVHINESNKTETKQHNNSEIKKNEEVKAAKEGNNKPKTNDKDVKKDEGKNNNSPKKESNEKPKTEDNKRSRKESENSELSVTKVAVSVNVVKNDESKNSDIKTEKNKPTQNEKLKTVEEKKKDEESVKKEDTIKDNSKNDKDDKKSHEESVVPKPKEETPVSESEYDSESDTESVLSDASSVPLGRKIAERMDMNEKKVILLPHRDTYVIYYVNDPENGVEMSRDGKVIRKVRLKRK